MEQCVFATEQGDRRKDSRARIAVGSKVGTSSAVSTPIFASTYLAFSFFKIYGNISGNELHICCGFHELCTVGSSRPRPTDFKPTARDRKMPAASSRLFSGFEKERHGGCQQRLVHDQLPCPVRSSLEGWRLDLRIEGVSVNIFTDAHHLDFNCSSLHLLQLSFGGLRVLPSSCSSVGVFLACCMLACGTGLRKL